jgi:hypothetical protein
MPSEQSPSDASNDIFSLSDRVLAEKLLFVKEVRFPIPKLILTAPAILSCSLIPSDWLRKLGQRLVMPAESAKRPERDKTRCEACASIQDSHNGRSCSITVSDLFCHVTLRF